MSKSKSNLPEKKPMEEKAMQELLEKGGLPVGGAMIGAIIAGPIGAAIGGIVGGVVTLIKELNSNDK